MLAACGGVAPTSAPPSQGSSAFDPVAAKEQAKTFVTYATPNNWANFGEQITTFCTVKFGFDCNRTERSQAEELLSAQVAPKFAAEKNNPVAIVADSSILFTAPSEQTGALADYLSPGATALPDGYKGENGGWIATYAGVPGFAVNVDLLTSKGLPIPASWEDLTNAAYKGMIGMTKPGSGGVSTTTFAVWNMNKGGTFDDYSKGAEFAKRMLPNLTGQATVDTFEKGEVPITVNWDFNLIALVAKAKASGVTAKVVIPSDGSVYGASVLLVNKYDTAHSDFAKMFMDWLLSDEGQTIFARFGARPIRSVVGDTKFVVPDSAKANWLPDDAYKNVKTIDGSKIDVVKIADIWTNQVLAGN